MMFVYHKGPQGYWHPLDIDGQIAYNIRLSDHQMLAMLQKGVCLAVYPEGKLSDQGTLNIPRVKPLEPQNSRVLRSLASFGKNGALTAEIAFAVGMKIQQVSVCMHRLRKKDLAITDPPGSQVCNKKHFITKAGIKKAAEWKKKYKRLIEETTELIKQEEKKG